MKKITYLILIFIVSTPLFAQEEDLKAKEKSLKNSKNYTWEGNKKLSEDNFIAAEADYRVAISESPENAIAPFNLGNAYYNNETYSEAFGRFKEAGVSATAKTEKHNAYHNMGNVFMKRKDYAKAVEAYKEALRNDPTDEETRYNLALAKELLKKDEENKDKNQDNKDEQDKEDKKDQDKEGDNEDEKDQDKKDEGDKGDEGDQDDKGDKKEDEGDGDDKKEQNKKPEQGDNQKDQPQPKPNQLSKQQVENLLRAMQNAEKKVQEKIDAKKVQGAKVKTEKDW
ncbi:tetratricopeptide repeat protein [Maribacter antarcticus]|uniref:tetratricopeptide repeat protein n=1 Tax=Maribacter antarcticus TaxID=505250 RepID=UPI00047AE542|nr:tetratricopeptide repeat protein [Maribacter antarcticus]